MRLSRGRRTKTPNYRIILPNVMMFYSDVECCAHCRSAEEHNKGFYCMLLRYDGYHKKLRDRRHMVVQWNAICDKFKLRYKKRKYERKNNDVRPITE